MKISRKDLLRSAVAAIGASSLGCGGGDDSASGSKSSCSSDIVSNHGHVLTVSAADVAAGADKDYNIQGTADHNHQVTITKAHFADLKAGTLVALTSTTAAGHVHSITVQCE